MENNSAKRPVHVGRNIQRFRLIRGLSQAGLAHQLEDKRNKSFSQQLVSDIEDREAIPDEELLQQIAEILEVSPEALKTLDLDNAINIIGSTFTYNDQSINQPINPIIHQTFNPLEKLIELFEKEKAELKAEIEELKNELQKK